eukprot:CAMPEP_0181083974 /NCGR_PEP_ID=MMETSP1071-20121207/4450_1 /TAXON_ID=35127 /ORGANISM="Thalassiosira sp., Strain NH16" /LENGTH=1372 /DNA_ID=CAMNT_0023165681 /DNA_START=213 /DNA_END=4331 /DNA_ORIENTATION=-
MALCFHTTSNWAPSFLFAMLYSIIFIINITSPKLSIYAQGSDETGELVVRTDLNVEKQVHRKSYEVLGDAEEGSDTEGGIESNHFFCGLDWNSVSNDCDGAQHCPTGIDDECELFGAVCFAGTTCDAAKGHGEMFKFLGLPYEDTRNTLFCASSWAEAGSNCSVEYWCRDGMCDNGMSCFGASDCNIQDLVKAELEAEKEANGDTDDNVTDNEPIMAVDDPKRSNFCGMTWGDASYQCQDWCPEGVECPEPQTCFADTSCYYDKDIAPSASPTTYPPSVSPTITYDKAENMSFCGNCWSDAQECTIERHCPNGDTDCLPSETCYNYIPGCNIVDLTKKHQPVTPPHMPPSQQPTGRPDITVPVEVDPGDMLVPTYTPTQWATGRSQQPTGRPDIAVPVEVDPGDMLIPTYSPTQRAIGWTDDETPRPSPPSWKPTQRPRYQPQPNDTLQSHSPTKRPRTWPPVKTDDVTKRYCGFDWADVTENCLTAVPCPGGDANGVCPSGMNCIAETPCSDETYLNWMINEEDDKIETEEEEEDVGWPESAELGGIENAVENEGVAIANADPPIPTSGPLPWPTTYIPTTYIPTQTTLTYGPTAAPEMKSYVKSTMKPTQIPTMLPTKRSTGMPTKPLNNVGAKQNYCATTRASLELRCAYAATCNANDLPCPQGTYCWGDHLCSEATTSSGLTPWPTTYKPTTYIPTQATLTYGPTASPEMKPNVKSTNIPTMLPTKRNAGLPSIIPQEKTPTKIDKPELYCASAKSQLESRCGSAQSCSNGPCPKGMFCFPFTCESKLKDDQISSGTFYCATGFAELDEICGLATECTGKEKACQKGQYCLPYNCKQSLHKCPLMFIGWHSSQDCKQYYKCINGVVIGDIKTCEPFLKFDKVRGHCITEDLVNEYCYGGPSVEIEQEQHKETVTSQGTSLVNCQKGYVGWQSRDGKCKEYYECRRDGSIGPTRVCREGTKFDKTRGVCYDEMFVNNSCLGERGIASSELCPKGYVGGQSRDGKCKEYYECRSDGSVGPTHVCSEGTKFDEARGVCYDKAFVLDSCSGKIGIGPRDLCPGRYVGWQSRDGECKEYYECKRDGSIGPTHVCGEGSKFDKARGVCYAEAFVDDSCHGHKIDPSVSSSGDANNPGLSGAAGAGSGSALGSIATGYPHQPDPTSNVEHGGYTDNVGISDAADVSNSPASGNDLPSGGSDGNPQQTDLTSSIGKLGHSDAASANNIPTSGYANSTAPRNDNSPAPGNDLLTVGSGDNAHQTGISSGVEHSGENNKLGHSSAASANNIPASENASPYGDEYDNTHQTGDEAGPHQTGQQATGSGPSLDANKTQLPPWYIQHTIVDPSGGSRFPAQFMSKYACVLSMALIQWTIHS